MCIKTLKHSEENVQTWLMTSGQRITFEKCKRAQIIKIVDKFDDITIKVCFMTKKR